MDTTRGRAFLGDGRSVVEARGPSRGKHRGILMTSPLRLAILMLILAACSCSRSTSSAPSADTLQAAAKPDVPVQRLDLTYEKPVVGAKVRAVASDLPAGKTVDLKWSTVTGGWVIEDYYYFRGKKYSETTSSLGKFPVNSNGRLNASFTIPEDYGGAPYAPGILADKTSAQNSTPTTPTLERFPTWAPIANPIVRRGAGLRCRAV